MNKLKLSSVRNLGKVKLINRGTTVVLCSKTIRSGEVFKENFTDIFQTNLEQVAFSLESGKSRYLEDYKAILWKKLCSLINRRFSYLTPTKKASFSCFSNTRNRFPTISSYNGGIKVVHKKICSCTGDKRTRVYLLCKSAFYISLASNFFKSNRSKSKVLYKRIQGTKGVPISWLQMGTITGVRKLVAFGEANLREAFINSPASALGVRKQSFLTPKANLVAFGLQISDLYAKRRFAVKQSPKAKRFAYKSEICNPKVTSFPTRFVKSFSGHLPLRAEICNPKSTRFARSVGQKSPKATKFASIFVRQRKQPKYTYEQKNEIKQKFLHKKTNSISLSIKIGDYLSSGDKIGERKESKRLKKTRKPIILTSSGRVLTISKTELTLQKTQPILFYNSAFLHVQKGDWVKEGSPILRLTHQTLMTGDIVQGIPRIEQLFEAFTSPTSASASFNPNEDKRSGIRFKDVHESLHSQVRDIFRKHWVESVLPIAVRKSLEEIGYILVEMIQKVYLSQGVLIADKHIEIIIRGVASKGQILDSGTTGLFLEEVLPIRQIENANLTTPGKKCLYIPAVMGLTATALNSDSFISAASFQETTRVLSRDAVYGKSDFLRGLKEKVVIGDLISAGTGLEIYFIYTTILSS